MHAIDSVTKQYLQLLVCHTKQYAEVRDARATKRDTRISLAKNVTAFGHISSRQVLFRSSVPNAQETVYASAVRWPSEGHRKTPEKPRKRNLRQDM